MDGRFVDIEGATERSYQVPADERELQHRLVVSYTDRQLYTNTISAAALPFSRIADFVDKDGDGLIEISTIEELNAIRHQPDGSGYVAESGGSRNSSGCPDGTCEGYELVRNLDFDDADSYSTMNSVVIARLQSWRPISGFAAEFEGNEFTISNLTVSIIGRDGVGLFANARGDAEIRNISLAEVDVEGDSEVGALVGEFEGSEISNVHILSGDVVVNEDTGGCMIGSVGSGAVISDSSANCTITGNDTVGGLVGESSADIERSFAIGLIMEPQLSDLGDTSNVGGLVADTSGDIADSYAAVDIRTQSVSNSNFLGVGGLAGRSQGDIINSYAIGDVTIVGDARLDFVGGFGR